MRDFHDPHRAMGLQTRFSSDEELTYEPRENINMEPQENVVKELVPTDYEKLYEEKGMFTLK